MIIIMSFKERDDSQLVAVLATQVFNVQESKGQTDIIARNFFNGVWRDGQQTEGHLIHGQN